MNPKSQIAQYFPDYDGPTMNYEAGRDFFKKKLARLNRSTTKEVYTQYVIPIQEQ